MERVREPKRRRPAPAPAPTPRAPAPPAPQREPARGPAEGNAVAAVAAQLDAAVTQPLPHQADLEAMFAMPLSWIRRASGVRDAVLSVGARGAATAETVGFAEPEPPFELVAHEVAHVLQHRVAHGVGDAEGEARAAREHAARGDATPFVVRAAAADHLQLDDGPGPQPPRPARLESPVAMTIAGDMKTAVPGSATHTVTLSAGDLHTTFTIEEQIASADLVTVYAVPLEDTFPTPQAAADAREKNKHALNQPFQIPPAKPQAAAVKPPSRPPVAPVKPPPPAPSAPVNVAPVVDTRAPTDVVYDLAGTPIKLIDRAPGFGVTQEFTKLAVGSAACGVLKTRDGTPIIVDAGVGLVKTPGGQFANPALVKQAMARLRQLVPKDMPIEIVYSHAHLDHTALTEAIGHEFVISKITVNTVQLRGETFQDALRRVAKQQDLRRKIQEGQLEIERKKLEDRLRSDARAEWEAKQKVELAEVEQAASEAKFEEFLSAKVDAEIQKLKLEPLKVEVHVPMGTGGATIKIELPGIEIVPIETQLGPGKSFVAKDARGTTIIDLDFAEATAKTKDVIRKKGNEEGGGSGPDLDKLESNYVFELHNGGKLVVLPDIRAVDIVKNGSAIVKAVTEMGGGVALIDVGHHFRKTFMKAGTKVERVGGKASGLILGSDLAKLSKVLTTIASKSNGAYVMTSSELKYIEPAVFKFLELCGLTAVPTLAGETQFISAITAKGERVEGFAAGKRIDMESAALLQRTDLTLDKLKQQHDDAVRDERVEAETIKGDAEQETRNTKGELASLKEQRAAVADAIKRKAFGGKTRDDLVAEREAFDKRIGEVNRRLGTKATKERLDAALKNGPAHKKRVELLEKHNAVAEAKQKLLEKLQKQVGKHTGKAPTAEVLKAELHDEIAALEKVVDPAFDALKKQGELPVLSETSLVLLKQEVARTPENEALIDAWEEAYKAHEAALKPDAKVGDQIDYLDKLGKLRDEIKKRKDIGDQKAVEDELAFIDEQLKSGTEQLRKLAESQGEKRSDIDPLTGAKVEQTIVSNETAEQAAARERATDTPAPDVAAPKPASTEPAEPAAEPAAEPVAKPTAYQRFDKAVRTLADVGGRVMGGVMVFQSIKGTADLIDRYSKDEITLGQAAAGTIQNAMNVRIGYRMLTGAHVSPVEFVIVSALEVTGALLADYASTAEQNTEVTYALISAGLNTALMMVGGWLMTLGPVGILAGLLVMAAGDHILNALGVKTWLAKMFDPRPNEIIDADRDLQKLVEKYAFEIGARQLAERDVPSLAGFGASDPQAVKDEIAKQREDRRDSLMKQEVELMDSFDAAYKRAQKGYAGLKWLDDQRARFLSLYLQVHKDDAIPEAGQVYARFPHWYSSMPELKTMMGRETVFARLKATEGFVSLANATEDDVRGMEQWSKLNERIGELTELLYHDEVDPDNYKTVDWMKVFEALSMLEQMIANARYRLDPSKQSTHRVAPLLPDGPPKKLYELLLLQYENRVDVLRERVLDMSMGTGAPTGIKTPGKGLFVGKDVMGLPELRYDIGTYYEPDYGDVTKSPTEQALLRRLSTIVNEYDQLITEERWEWSELPEGVTLQTLKSSVDVIRTYRKRLLHDDAYKAYIFNLQATRAATIGVMERAHRLLDASPTARDTLVKADKDFEASERERIDTYGHYFADELPALEEKVGMAHARALSSMYGDTDKAEQLTALEHVAAADESLLEYHLGTIRDRAIKAGVVVPVKPDEPFQRLFALRSNNKVIVAVPPETEVKYVNLQITMYETFDVVPVNADAVTWFGNKATRAVPLFDLVPVTVNNLRGVKPIADTPLREKPATLDAAERIGSWVIQ